MLLVSTASDSSEAVVVLRIRGWRVPSASGRLTEAYELPALNGINEL